MIRVNRSSYKFTKGERIHLQREIERLFKFGQRDRGDYFNFIYSESPQRPDSRIAVLFPHGFKGAVLRNKLKRYAREIFRIEKRSMRRPADMIFQFKWMKNNSCRSQLESIREEFVRFLIKAGNYQR